MSGKVPAWAVAPVQRGRWLLTTKREDGTSDESWVIDDKPGSLIGRNGQVVDVVVDHKSSSRVHACIAFDKAGDPHLVDLGSAHGTALNDSFLPRNGSERLANGDRIAIAACLLQYHVTRINLPEGQNKMAGSCSLIRREQQAQPSNSKGSPEGGNPSQAAGTHWEEADEATYRSAAFPPKVVVDDVGPSKHGMADELPEPPKAIDRGKNEGPRNRHSGNLPKERISGENDDDDDDERFSSQPVKGGRDTRRHIPPTRREQIAAVDAKRSERPDHNTAPQVPTRDGRRSVDRCDRQPGDLSDSGHSDDSRRHADDRDRDGDRDKAKERDRDRDISNHAEANKSRNQGAEAHRERRGTRDTHHHNGSSDARGPRDGAHDQHDLRYDQRNRNARPGMDRQTDMRRRTLPEPDWGRRGGRGGYQRFGGDRHHHGSNEMSRDLHPRQQPFNDRAPSRSDRRPDRHHERSDRRPEKTGRRSRDLSPPPRRRRSPHGKRRRSVSSPSPKRRRTPSPATIIPRAEPQLGSGFGSGAAAVVGANPAEVVRAMMGFNGVPPPMPTGGSFLGVNQKKKLLWGAKKAEGLGLGSAASGMPLGTAATGAVDGDGTSSGTVAAVPTVVGGSVGANRWDTAQFDDEAERDKFQRLMGVKAGPPAPGPLGTHATFDRVVTGRSEQERLKADLERSFLEGIRRSNNNPVGLGL